MLIDLSKHINTQLDPLVVIEFGGLGSITLEVYRSTCPQTADHFMRHVVSGFYEGTLLHRIYPGFVIQMGQWQQASGLDLKLALHKGQFEKKASPFLTTPYEFGDYSHSKYTVGMALDRNTQRQDSQFFINLQDNKHFNATKAHKGPFSHVVFAQVVEGTEVVDKLASTLNRAQATERITGERPLYALPDQILDANFDEFPNENITITKTQVKP